MMRGSQFLEGPDWNVYSVVSYDEVGRRETLGGSLHFDASRAMWEVFVTARPRCDVMLCHGARVIRRSKRDWPLCGGAPR